ncbi:hypothetical protein VOLCADRAFT_89871 [Volvox carteri f. nagariensis]|uniref:Dienelactone hydrolase domain-containing protein n=1 Tax=Volvox carteri f. nagariensis TaxID=3068 RepID=D8TSW0_VOLCA|nr:uncharacterized protein VOLCADRAFT_89871 [Volvox carteri f. nagariensis]EFJ49549.1 hypothetical protein VOLCADRAFT_89871 [Volvox carteri f. nagariensis]|eukprot:XP_002949530.1 hypothetical protein VOLCADRAFT_89871 [Volvox carteri f. nagariensis]
MRASGLIKQFSRSQFIRAHPNRRLLVQTRAMASEACCSAGKPVQLDYEPKGKFDKVGDLPIYRSGSGNLGLVIIPDIFGFGQKQVFQVCDRFAEAGLNVCAIDPFHGEPWTLSKFPPKPEHDFMGWLGRVGSWEALQPQVYAAVERLRSEGATKLSCIGFCWGVSIALRAGQDGATFSGAGGAHPALFGKDADLAEKVACPVILLPAKGDASYEVFQKALGSRPYGNKCVYQRFDDQVHGFVAARGDWSDPAVAAAAGKAIHLMTHFLTEVMA